MNHIFTQNKNNIDFYQNIEIEKFKEIAKKSGFDTGIDIELIYPDIAKAEVLVELGLGYGRTVEHLRRLGFEGRMYALERSEKFLDYAKKEKVLESEAILPQDIRHIDLPEKADAILWLWSGILEQTLEQQKYSICKIREYLKPKGKLFIEAPQGNLKVVGVKIDKHYIRVETEWGILEAYLPYEEDIRQMAAQCGYQNVRTLPYLTPTGLERIIYILEN
ncbi:class I SAM-dependent methyltransferase [Hugenholtzia roseola]|uniref:class I SAM-dependent methyltransferase n=1 Tax=Hugenholtzia roseola TaxID=1002 RepID=UPI0003F6DD03|nr:methyltransferase domain-containing protein [Hugenholtzia roseola]